MTRPAIALLAVCLTLGAGFGIAAATQPGQAGSPRTTDVRRAPVESRSVICPDLHEEPGRTVDTLAAASVGSGTAPSSAPGSVVADPISTLTPPFPAQLLMKSPGTAGVLQPDRTLGPVQVTATGAVGPGFEAEQYTRSDGGTGRGWSSVRCEAPRSEAWYAGADTRSGQHSLLFLSNPDPLRATVDVTLWGPKGELPSSGGQGIVVDPNSGHQVDLSTVAPDVYPLLVHVQVRSGRAAVALRVQSQDGDIAKGIDWLPRVDAPARVSVLPGLYPHAGDHRTLFLGNPGTADATATVHLISSDGSFVPTGLDHIRAPAGQVTLVDVSAQAAQSDAALVVSADRPLVSSAQIAGPADQATGTREYAFTAATPPLTEPGLVAASVADPSWLELSAPRQAAVVRLVVPTRNGNPPAPRDVSIGAGRTVRVQLNTLVQGWTPMSLAIVPQPGSGPVYAARVTYESGTRGALFTVLPVRPAPVSIAIPAVVSDPMVVTGGS